MTLKIFKHAGLPGTQCILLDLQDWHHYQKSNWCYYTTPRHNSIYVVVPNSKAGKVEGHGRLHRLILNAPKDMVVDHINGNALDNRRANLRLTTQSGNNKNATKRRNAISSKYKGTHEAYPGRWKAQIQKNGKKYILGTFDTEIEAAKAYNIAAQLLHGEFAKLNIIPEAG